MQGSLNVINGYRESFEGEGIVYIGRQNWNLGLPKSLLANPFRVNDNCDRQMAVQKYRTWLWERIQERGLVWDELNWLADKVEAGEDISLSCYCAPKACHGDIVKNAVEWIIDESQKQAA